MTDAAACPNGRRPPLLFNTLEFLAFFGAFLGLFFLTRPDWRRWVVLGGSLGFYGLRNPWILLLLIATTLANFVLVRRLEMTEDLQLRKKLVAAAVLISLFFLAFFKYTLFTLRGVNSALSVAGGHPFTLPDLVLPAGISFYTFQLISYSVDVYRREAGAEKSFWNLLLFVTYFPKLIAGPIERAREFLPGLVRPSSVTPDMFSSGATLALWGLLKKVFVADNISPFVDSILRPGVDPPAFATSIAALALAIQIYADFSGYTDMARGFSRMIGVELSLNFHLPVLASNPAEIWRRWHITVGAFFRDYIYIPLGGGRAGLFRKSLNILIVWVAGGLWHGASLGFLVWGIYCGLLIIGYSALSGSIARLGRTSGVMDQILLVLGRIFTTLTFAHGLLLFRVDSPAHLWRVVVHVFDWSGPGLPFDTWGRLLFFTWPLIAMQVIQAWTGRMEWIHSTRAPLRAAVIFVLLVLVVGFGSFRGEQFFYFQF